MDLYYLILILIFCALIEAVWPLLNPFFLSLLGDSYSKKPVLDTNIFLSSSLDPLRKVIYFLIYVLLVYYS